MKSIVRTVLGAALNNAIITGLPYDIKEYTTLNEKLEINKDESLTLSTSTYPQLKYFCIGNGGHKVEVVEGITKIAPIQHKTTDFSPYNIIPFVLRQINNDLTNEERAKYGLRKLVTYNNTKYIAYYLKRLDYTNSSVEMNNVIINADGTKTTSPFVPTSDNLNPTPTIIDSSGTNVVTPSYVSVSNLIQIKFSEVDCTELKNVANIMYGDEEMSIVSEICLVSGVDKTMSSSTPGLSDITIKEVIAAQVDHIVTTFHSASINNLGFDIDINYGDENPEWETDNIDG